MPKQSVENAIKTGAGVRLYDLLLLLAVDLSNCLHIFQSVFLCARLSTHLSIWDWKNCLHIFHFVLLYARLSAHLLVCLTVCPTVYPSFSLSDCMPIFQSVWLYAWLSAHLSVCLTLCQTVCQTVCPSVSLFDCMPDRLPIFQSVRLYAHLSVCLTVCLTVRPTVYPSYSLSDCMPDCLPIFIISFCEKKWWNKVYVYFAEAMRVHHNYLDLWYKIMFDSMASLAMLWKKLDTCYF